MLSIRRANPCEAEALTELAIRSEAYWSYDSEYMESFKAVYAVTGEFIKDNSTFVLEQDGQLIGFYGILKEKLQVSLEYFFIKPEYIGQGYGKLLWKHVVDYCKSVPIHEFSIVTSPQAKEFYSKMGAVCTGEVESLLRKGRKIPSLTCRVEK
jgi:GNAT superfamily N-acetyltransferase